MTEQNQIKEEIHKTEQKPDEHVGFYYSSFIKIFDPETNEILVQKRGDN